MEITTWSAEALATFAASALAAVIGAASLISGLLEARAARRRLDEVTRREQWWVRWTWAAERAVSPDSQASQMAVAVMEALADMPWITKDDMRILTRVKFGNGVRLHVDCSEHEGRESNHDVASRTTPVVDENEA